MPIDRNPLVIVSDTPLSSGAETTSNPITASTSLPSYDIPNTNAPAPMLVTPVIEASPVPPKGSGASVVAEPELGTPIVKADNPKPVGSSTPSPYIGGGAGAGGGSEEETKTNDIKKPNYVLYLGILLAIIVAYKVLSKKKEN